VSATAIVVNKGHTFSHKRRLQRRQKSCGAGGAKVDGARPIFGLKWRISIPSESCLCNVYCRLRGEIFLWFPFKAVYWRRCNRIFIQSVPPRYNS